MLPDINIYNEQVDLSRFLQVEVYGRTLLAENGTLEVWTTTNGELTSNQVSNPIAIFDPKATSNPYSYASGNSAIQNQIVDQMNTCWNKGHGGQTDGQDAFGAFCKNVLQNKTYMNAMSEALGPVILNLLQMCWNTSKDGSLSSGQMSIVTSANQYVSGNAQQNQSVGQGAIKTEGSQIQTTTGLPANITEMVNAVLAILGAIAGLLQQSYS